MEEWSPIGNTLEMPTEAEEMDLLRNSFWTDVYDEDKE